MLRTILIGSLGLSLAGTVEAAEVFASEPERAALLELFTSEGCSSCPPAEEWLGKLRDDAGLWTQFVPIAFHVNYWDRLGWPDRFARREYTDRQYAYARIWGAQSVYTPEFVRNGREWRRGQPSAAPTASGVLTVERLDDANWRVNFKPAGKSLHADAFEIQIAVLGGGIVTPVRRGENAGKTLRHEFVALGLEQADLVAAGRGLFAAEVELKVPEVDGVSRIAIAAWVMAEGESEPLQAVGGWLK